jgi:hypothetical protein
MSPREGKLTVSSAEQEYHDAIKKDIKEFGYSLCECYNIVTATSENEYISLSSSGRQNYNPMTIMNLTKATESYTCRVIDIVSLDDSAIYFLDTNGNLWKFADPIQRKI